MVNEHDLPEEVVPVIDEYDRVVEERDRFLWRWLHHVFPHFELTCVPPEHTDRVRNTKLLASIFVAVADDVAEKHADYPTFEEISNVPFETRSVDPNRSKVDEAVVEFTRNVWRQIMRSVRSGPRSDEVTDLILFDIRQVLDAIEYSYVANEHVEMINERELWRYDSYNMMLYVYADIDLAYSPAFDRSDLAALRELTGHAQRMARIGNWLTTWERELGEGDVVSGVVVRALENGVVSLDDLHAIADNSGGEAVGAVIAAIDDADIEEEFVHLWHEEMNAARRFEGQIDSMAVAAYLDGFETVFQYHLASRGLK